MKHLLNNLSEEEKNRIREQHTGGVNINIENFRTLVETKQGNVKLYLSEQPKTPNFAPVAQKVTEGCSKLSHMIVDFVKGKLSTYGKLIQAVKAKPEDMDKIILSMAKNDEQREKFQSLLDKLNGMSCDELEATLHSAYQKEEGKNMQEQVAPLAIEPWLPWITLTFCIIVLILKLAFGSSGCSSGTCYRF